MAQASVPVSLHSQAASVPMLNGTNFTEWSENVKFTLGALDLDRSLLHDRPTALTVSSSLNEKSAFDAWEKSNRLSLMFMRMTVASNIKTSLPQVETAKQFMTAVEERFRSADKSLAGTLIAQLTTMKYDGVKGMQEHILEMTNIAARLNGLGMNIKESFLVRFILNSLPPQYGPFQMNYNSLKEEWNVNELASMIVQEETRLKQQGDYSAHFVTQEAGKKKWKPRKGKKFKPSNNGGPANASQAQKEDKRKCHFCRKVGHFYNYCPKRKGWFEKKGILFKPNPKPN